MSANDVTRRRFLRTAALAAVAGGGVAVGLRRRELLAFLRADAEDPDGFQVLRRPFPTDPTREVSALGFGCGSKLAIVNRDKRCLDEELNAALMDYAYRHGVNYFDTAYIYHDGESERFLGRHLKRYPRESFWLCDKMMARLLKKPEDAPAMFEEQLKRCQVDYFDNYMLHTVKDPDEYERVYKRWKVLDYLKEEKSKGRIRHLSVSFHGTSEFLKRVLDDYPWESVLILINALEHRWNPDSLKVAAILAERKIPILVMEPLAGGRAARLNAEGLKILADSGRGMSGAEWGFRYAQSFPGVLSVLSGMSRMDWLKENIRTFSTAHHHGLTAEERQIYDRAADAAVKYETVPCATCRYCVPCPYGVEIPEVFSWWNAFAGAGRIPAMSGANDSQALRREFLASYSQQVRPGCGPEKCIRCKKCLNACPQWTFKIPDEMRKIERTLAEVRSDYVAKGGRL